MTRLLAICALALSIPLSNSFAQNTFFYADSIFSKGIFSEAAIAYERIVFRSDNDTVKAMALLRKAECYKKLNEFQKAERTLNRVGYFNLPDSLSYRLLYQSALYSYLNADFSDAESSLLQIHHFIKDSLLIQNSLLLYALILNEQKRWHEAEEKMKQWILFSDERQKSSASLIKMYDSENFPHLKNPKLAKRLSMLLPGLGQLYSKAPLESLLSLALISTGGYFVVQSFISGYYITTFTYGTGILQAFYIGGFKRAEYLAERSNYRIIRGYNERLKKEILELISKE